MEIRKVKTAVVGCGMISKVYLRNMTELLSIIDVVAVCDMRRESAEAAAQTYHVPKVLTAEEIAADPEIELVIVLTGPAVHYEVIKMMLNAGKHVYSEKTLTDELEKSREVVALAKEKGLYLGCAPDTVLGASIQTARWAIEQGLIGKVTSALVSINRNQTLNSETFRFLRGPGGALPYDVGIYYIAAVTYLLGPVAEITGFGAPAPVHQRHMLYREDTQDSWQIPGNNLVTGALKFRSGALGMLHFDGNTIGAECSSFRIYGTEGILEVGDPNTYGEPVILRKEENAPCTLPMTHGYNGVSFLPDATDFEKGYGHRGIGVAEMAWAIRKGRPCRMNADFALHAHEVLAGLDIAAATGAVYRPESTFTSAPLKPGFYSSIFGGHARGDAELSLVD